MTEGVKAGLHRATPRATAPACGPAWGPDLLSDTDGLSQHELREPFLPLVHPDLSLEAKVHISYKMEF